MSELKEFWLREWAHIVVGLFFVGLLTVLAFFIVDIVKEREELKASEYQVSGVVERKVYIVKESLWDGTETYHVTIAGKEINVSKKYGQMMQVGKNYTISGDKNGINYFEGDSDAVFK